MLLMQQSWELTSGLHAEKEWLDLTWDFELKVHAPVADLLQQDYISLLIPPKQSNGEQNIQIYWPMCAVFIQTSREREIDL